MLARRAEVPTVAAMLIACAGLFAQQGRDVQPTAARVTATATMTGRVLVDGPTKQPARHATVTIVEAARATPGQTTTTDDSGVFTFAAVPAGRFEVQASKNGYLRASYGATRPNRAGTPLVVKDGDRMADVTLTIAHGGVITGIVRDTHGQPVPNTPVKALRLSYSALNGERTLGVPDVGGTTQTDDRGEYRAYGLPPGGYMVLANMPDAHGGPLEDDDIHVLTTADVDRALQAGRPGAPSAAAVRATPPTSSGRVNYAPIFYPGVTDVATAGTIALGLSEERRGVDITVQLIPTATITGILHAPDGVSLPPVTRVSLLSNGGQAEMLAGAGLRGISASVDATGAYRLAGVAPGTYTLKAATSPGPGGRAAAAPWPSLWAAVDVQVNGQDLDVPLTLQPGVDIHGHIAFDGAAPVPDEVKGLRFLLAPPASGGMVLNLNGGVADGDGQFTLTGVVPDAYQFGFTWPNAASGAKWMLKASVANGKDALDGPLRVSPGETLDWTVTFTDKPSVLSGIFQNRGGRAATDYYILVYPTDWKFWTPSTRRIRTTRPATDGAFAVKGLPDGEYYLAALTDLESGEWNDPTLLEQVAPSALKVMLREGTTTTQDLRIGGGPPGLTAFRYSPFR